MTQRTLPELEVYKTRYMIKKSDSEKLAAKHLMGSQRDISLFQGFDIT
jgi:hypothetical protein